MGSQHARPMRRVFESDWRAWVSAAEVAVVVTAVVVTAVSTVYM